MKTYQVIMPLALPFALAASVFYMVQQRTDVNTQYRQYIQAAEEYLRNDVVSDALDSYQAAMQLNPTLEVALAVGQVYFDHGEYRQAENWYEDELLAVYPEESDTYRFGIETQLAQGNVREAYQIYDLYQERGLQSDAVEQTIQPVRYSFDLIGDYEAVAAFSNTADLAAVQQNGGWGYIDTTGSKVIANLYAQAGTFADLAPVVDSEGEAFYIDATGNKKLTASYFLEKDPELGKVERFGDIQSGLVMAYNGNVWNYYDRESHEKRFGGYEYATVITGGVGGVSHDGKNWALISADGQELTDFVFEEIVLDAKGVPCRTNALLVRQGGQYLLVDTAGAPISDNRYDDARAFNEAGLAAVRKDGRWIAVNETGEETDLGDFEDLKSFSAGVAAAKQGGKWGYIDQAGTWLIEPQFADAQDFNSSGVAFVQDEKETWHLLSLFRMHHE